MARYLFDGGEVVIDSAGNTQANYPFTVWTERTGGTNVTADVKAPDGVTSVAVQTDSDGEVPYLRGPDEVRLLYRDMGTDTRTPWYSAEAIAVAMEGAGGGGLSTVAGLIEALFARPEWVRVFTGSEARPTSSEIVVWVSSGGVAPANATAGDVVLDPI